MGRPALPKNIHILKGTAKKHPGRMRGRENEPENKNPLGEAPEELSEKEQVYWDKFKNESIDGVLGEADRVAVAMASKLTAKVFSDEATASEMGQLIKLLSQFGMTPADRSKINLSGNKKQNAFDD